MSIAFIGKRAQKALAWRRAWAKTCRSFGASFVSSHDVTNLGARFPRDVDMDDVTDQLMAPGFAVSEGENTVRGFPSDIQDPVTGEPTLLEGLD